MPKKLCQLAQFPGLNKANIVAFVVVLAVVLITMIKMIIYDVQIIKVKIVNFHLYCPTRVLTLKAVNKLKT